MKTSLKDLKLMLVYVFEYVIEGRRYSAVLKPIDAANGVILDEVPGQPGMMLGHLVSGGLVHIPIEGITNHFQSWWKVFGREGDGGWGTEYTDDIERVGKQAQREVGKDHLWDEDGCYKQAKEVDRPSPEAKRIYPKDKRPDKYKD